MKAYMYQAGFPAGGHIYNGTWHPGRVDGCPKCPKARCAVHPAYEADYCPVCGTTVPITER